MKGFKGNLEKDSKDNLDYRRVLYTSGFMQLVLVNLKLGEELGEVTNLANDQFFRVEKGYGKCIIDEMEYSIRSGDCLVIPAGARFNIFNTDDYEEMKMFSIYSPPQFEDGIVRLTKEDASYRPSHYSGSKTE